LGRIAHVNVVHHTEQIDVYLGPAEHLESVHDLLVRGLLPFGDSVVIVEFLWSIEAETDIKIFLGEKLAPLIIDGRAVGLYTIDDLLTLENMFLLQFDSFAKKVDAEQRRLAAVPGEAHDFLGRGLNMLNNITLQCLVVQTKIGSLGIEFFLFEVIAVMTVEVA